jgi:hypothetical protein
MNRTKNQGLIQEKSKQRFKLKTKSKLKINTNRKNFHRKIDQTLKS